MKKERKQNQTCNCLWSDVFWISNYPFITIWIQRNCFVSV